jgi:hypothetical protein
MPNKMQPIPSWAETLLQGLAYWVGYQRSRYFGYHLTEGAIMAEAAALIAARLGHRPGDPGPCVQREYLMRTLVGNARDAGSKRLDLLIQEPLAGQPGEMEVSAVEVKRANAAPSLVDEDLRRLACILRDRSRKTPIRAFLLLVGEQQLPDRFVVRTEIDGAWRVRARKTVLQPQGIEGYRVVTRRVCVAASSLKSSDNAHSATLIELISQGA